MIKTISIFLTTILLTFNSKSQIAKENWMLGGTINYTSIQRNSENYGPPLVGYRFNINPNVGYFFIDKFAGGVKVGIGKEGYKGPGTFGYNKYSDFNIGPYVRYYFLTPENNLNILVEGVYQYGFEVGNAHDPSSKNTFNFSAGPAVYFNTSVGLELLLSYSTSKFSGINGSNNTIMLGLGLQVHLEKE